MTRFYLYVRKIILKSCVEDRFEMRETMDNPTVIIIQVRNKEMDRRDVVKANIWQLTGYRRGQGRQKAGDDFKIVSLGT